METLDAGIKHDAGKLRYDLIPAKPLALLADVYTFGAKKYADHNWRKGLSFSRLFAASLRHMWAFWGGEDLDKESGLPHLAHAVFGLFALLEFTGMRPLLDDRYTPYCQCTDERACKKPEVDYWLCCVCNRRLK